jgi:hypothetical protein
MVRPAPTRLVAIVAAGTMLATMATACLGPAVGCTPLFSPDEQAAIEATWPGHDVTVAVHDERTGCRYDLAPERRNTTASVFKVAMLAGLVLRAQDEGRGLTPWEGDRIWPMITQSADGPTSELFINYGGAPAMAGLYGRLGLSDTVTADGTWGLTTTSARDQVELLRLLVGDRGGEVFGPEARETARYYLTNVVPEQRWGVPANAPGDWEVALKNGFFDSGCCRWRLNSVGRVAPPGAQGYEIAILTDGWPDAQSGIDVVNAIAGRINAALAVGGAIGALDDARVGRGVVTVGGWASEPPAEAGGDTPTAPIEVRVTVSGPPGTAPVQVMATAAGARPDVAAVFPVGPAHGFVVTVPAPGPGGLVACVEAVNRGYGGNAMLGCRNLPPATGSPVGFLDGVSDAGGGRVSVRGWAVDPDVDGPIDVHLYSYPAGGGAAIDLRAVTATGSRPDVGTVMPGYGPAHGFGTVFAEPAPGPWTVCAYGIEAGGIGANVLLGCGTTAG